MIKVSITGETIEGIRKAMLAFLSPVSADHNIDGLVEEQPIKVERTKVNPEAEDPGEDQATPAAVDLAEQNGIDITTVAGSGRGGRVTVADVKAAVSRATTAPDDDLSEPPGDGANPPDDEDVQAIPTGSTLEDAKQALEEVMNSRGFKVAQELLAGFGVTQLVKLDPGKFDDMIAQAQRLLGR